MHFTLVFDGSESIDLSFGLKFIPCPIWFQGERELLNLHPDNPHYQKGDLRRLLDKERIEMKLAEGQRHAVIVVHPAGHGSPTDLAALQDDLRNEDFTLQTLLSLAKRVDG